MKQLLFNYFKSDPLNGKPLKNIPGDPTGDALTYIAAVEPSLKIVAYPNAFLGKGLEFSSKQIDVSSGEASTKWLSFEGAPTSNYRASIIYQVFGKFNNFAEQLMVDITNGQAGVFTRLVIMPDGTVTALESFNPNINPMVICRLKPNVDYFCSIVVDMKSNSNQIGFIGPLTVGGEEHFNVHKSLKPMFDQLADVPGPIKPSISFQWDKATSGASKFTFGGVEIKQ